MASSDRNSHDTRAIPAAANLGIVRPPLVYLASIAAGLLIHSVRPVGLVPTGLGAPLGVAFAAIAMGFLSAGGLAVGHLVPKELTEMLQGVVVLAVAVSTVYVQRRSQERERPADRKSGSQL